jgi:heat shock protein 4
MHSCHARTHSQVSIVALKKSGLVVKSHAWDANLGGRDVDEALFDHFVAEVRVCVRACVRVCVCMPA